MSVVQKVDLSKEDYVLRGLFLSHVDELDRTAQGKTNLIFVKFVGSKKYGATGGFLYFGDLKINELEVLRGSKVDVLLQPSDKGFTVSLVQPTN